MKNKRKKNQKMKNKRIMALILSIGIFASSFSGLITTYAKNESEEAVSITSSLPEQNITELAPDIVSPDSTYVNVYESDDQNKILYSGTKSSLNPNDPDANDIYNTSGEEIESLLKDGYTIQDIYKADEIGNEICADPKLILETASSSGKSLDEVKNDIQKEQKDKLNNDYKGRYGKEYKELSKMGFSQDDILNILMYSDSNNIQVTDDLINSYKNNGKKAFVNKKTDKKLIKETKQKYKLSGKNAEKLSEDTIKELEKASEKTGISAKKLIDAYISCN